MGDAVERQWEIPNAVCVREGQGGLRQVVLTHPSGAGAEVYLQGAHVTSWKTAAGDEQFFVSRQSHFAAGRPIRGGIPVVFPQFGPGALPQHGFARTSTWELAGSRVGEGGSVEVTLALSESAETLALWPYRFRLQLSVCLDAQRLSIRPRVTDTDERSFSFQCVLHTYFRVQDIHRVALHGLDGVTFSDSLRGGVRETETRPAIRFDQETDRIYLGTPDTLRIEDEAAGRALTITKRNMPDVVVWNPWVAKAQRTADFGDEEWRAMLCAETGAIHPALTLGPGETWVEETIFQA